MAASSHKYVLAYKWAWDSSHEDMIVFSVERKEVFQNDNPDAFSSEKQLEMFDKHAIFLAQKMFNQITTACPMAEHPLPKRLLRVVSSVEVFLQAGPVYSINLQAVEVCSF